MVRCVVGMTDGFLLVCCGDGDRLIDEARQESLWIVMFADDTVSSSGSRWRECSEDKRNESQ